MAEDKDLNFIQTENYCVSQGYISKLDHSWDIIATSISAGLIVAIIGPRTPTGEIW